MSQLRVSLVITFLASNGSTAVNFVVSLILARLLSPEEVGVFSMTAVMVWIAHVFRDFGVTVYLQREKDLSPGKVRSASGVLIVTSWLLGALIFAASGLIADFLGEPRTRDVMRVLAAGFLFIPFGAVTQALLKRDLQARQEAIVTTVGTLVYAAAALIMAFMGLSYMSLAWANFISIIVSGLAYAAFRPAWAPWMPSFRGWRDVADFGTGTIVGSVLGQVNLALPEIWLGKASGAYDVGLLSRANGTAGIFMQVAGPTVNYAALPHLAQEHHLGHALGPTICKAAGYLTVCAWTPLLVTAIYAREVVLLLYGEKWIECAPLVSLLCVGTCVSFPFYFQAVGMQAIGRPYMGILPHAATLIARIVCILAIYDGDLLSFGIALLVAAVLLVAPSLGIHAHFFRARPADFVRALLPSAVVTTICVLTSFGLHAFTPPTWSVAPTLLIPGIVVPLLWLVCVALSGHPFSAEIQSVAKRNPTLERLFHALARKP